MNEGALLHQTTGFEWFPGLEGFDPNYGLSTRLFRAAFGAPTGASNIQVRRHTPADPPPF